MVIYYFEAPSEIFLKYYALLTFGLAILSVGFVGVPFIDENDVASPTKTFYLSLSGIAVIFLVGVMVVFLMDVKPEKYIAVISGITMLFVYGSALFETNDSVRIPRILKEYISILLLGIGLTMLGYSAPSLIVRFPQFAKPLRFIEGAVPVILWGSLAYAVYAGLRELATYSQRPALPVSPTPYYEHYQNADAAIPAVSTAAAAETPPPPKSETARMTGIIRRAIKVLEEDMELLTEQGESTCSIVRDVESGYVGARSAPESDDEYSLPAEEANARKDRRQQRAMNAFRNNRKLFSSLRSSHPVLECFADPPPSDPEEDDLRDAAQELQSMMENAEVEAGIAKADQVQVALAFSEKILDRGDKEEFQNAASTTSAPSAVSLQSLSGPQLLTAVRSLLQRAEAVHSRVLANQRSLSALQERVNRQLRKGSMVARGDYSGVGVLGPSATATAK